MYLRNATNEDCNLYYEWVNDANVRINAFDSKPIEKTTHEKWFYNRLIDPHTKLYILVDNDIEIGQVRIEEEDARWIIDYSIAKEYRGKNYGVKILTLLKKLQHRPLVGYVKKNNIASIKAFVKNNFTMKLVSLNNQEVFEFILQ